MSELKLRLAEEADVVLSGTIPFHSGSGLLVLAFHVQGRDAAREEGRRRAFDAPFFASIKEALATCPEGARLKMLLPKLRDAERSLNGVRREQQRLDLDKADAIERLTGEPLAVELGRLAAERDKLQERIDASAHGLKQMKTEGESLEAILRSNFSGWCSDAGLKKWRTLKGRREQLEKDLQTLPVSEALEKFEQADAEAATLEDGGRAVSAALHLLEEFLSSK